MSNHKNPLKVEYINSDFMEILFTRSHVGADDLIQAIKAHKEYEYEADHLASFEPPKQTYMRALPWSEGTWYEESGPGRGAFPVTAMVHHW